ncbi:GNAT family N-acetyltransferase [Arvimicrobium flavum]|uniref:GNAT family N-acetyltransferase n=1 Tax=Arvimicrobium flavum TaxID=3393320 RepID=UPI00237AE750|nr:GNAT family N-acetyltransferase [Mesorhizobium shangrilense]
MYVRTASDRDIDAIRALLIETWHDTYDAILGADRVREITDEWHSISALRRRLTSPRSEYLVADDGAAITGMAFAAADEKGETVTLHQLYVLPSWQGRGIGAMLLEEVISSFPDARAIRLEVEPENERAIGFYESQGFASSSEAAKDSLPGSIVPGRVYVRSLYGDPV